MVILVRPLTSCERTLQPANTVVDNWNREEMPMKKDAYGVWGITVPAKDGKPAIPHNSKVKVRP